MTELKTLKELADEHGFPFEAVTRDIQYVMIGLSPIKHVIGCDYNGTTYQFLYDAREWTLAKKQRTLTEYLYEEDELFTSGWFESKDDLLKYNVKILKTLRTEVIDD